MYLRVSKDEDAAKAAKLAVFSQACFAAEGVSFVSFVFFGVRDDFQVATDWKRAAPHAPMNL